MRMLFVLLLSVFFISPVFKTRGQDRKFISGKVNLPEGFSPEGILVFNENSGKGTLTRASGEFSIAVALDDRLKITSLLFQEFTVVIDQGVLDKGKLDIFLNEAITELPEIVVSPNKLTGNVNVDVAKIEVSKPDLPHYTAAQLNDFNYEYTPDSLTGVTRNEAMLASRTRLVNGLNFVNLFKAAVGESSKKEKNRPERDIDENVRQLYNDAFFKENLDIKIDRINDFIYYAQDHGLNKNMLRQGNELDLISFLIEQSKAYKQETEN